MNRSVSKVNDEWFADEDRVRASVGLLEKPATSKRQSQKEVLLYCTVTIHLRIFDILTNFIFAVWIFSEIFENKCL